jgi:hypothetical protein
VKNIAVIIAAVILILVLAISGYLILNYAKPSAQPNKTASEQTQPANSVSGSILSLLSGGKTVYCTIAYPDNKGTGKIYVSDKKFAGEFSIKDANGKEITSNTVSDGTYVYVWSSMMTNGVRMKLEDIKGTAQNVQSAQSVDLNQNVNLKCSPWTVDNSKFTAPTSIKFQDVSDLLQQAQPTAGATTQGTTSPCDQITDPTAKAACVKALSGQ